AGLVGMLGSHGVLLVLSQSPRGWGASLWLMQSPCLNAPLGVGKKPPGMSVKTGGSLRFPSNPRVPAPCSWTPVGPNTPGHCGVLARPPYVSTTEAPARNISGLDSTALGLAVYASQ